MKIILFGAGASGRMLYDELSPKNEITAFVDNDPGKWDKELRGIKIYEPKEYLLSAQYDAVVISAFCGLKEIHQQCLELGIPKDKIITSFFEPSQEARKAFLKNLSQVLAEYEQRAEVAEAGVYRGEFAKWINFYFPNRILHLFDTFEGFDARDLEAERQNAFSGEEKGHFSDTSVELVLAQMPYPKQCRIHKGYFPDSAEGLEHRFCFVNLDLDLYLPVYNGLLFFKDRMTEQGVILVHDYYSSGYKGARAAVEQFLAECNGTIYKYPIGDDASILLAGKWN